MKFVKMQGTGNDFVVIDDMNGELLGKEYETARKLCDRHFGIGADGILLVRKSNIADIKMDIFNSDGSYASMCGNGIRCFAKYVYEKKIVYKNTVHIETGDGIKVAKLKISSDDKVTGISINMGQPSFKPQDIPALSDDEIINKKINANGKDYSITSLFMGVPHTVVFEKIDDLDIKEGKDIEKLNIFPQGTNVNFCEVVSKDKIKVRTWERGAGPTLACGTGCCASVCACSKLNLTHKNVEVQILGGTLNIEITSDGVMMTGPAEVCFTGEIL